MPSAAIDWTLNQIIGLRRYLRLFQRELAGRLGVTEQTVWEWEAGRTAPSMASLKRLDELARSENFRLTRPRSVRRPRKGAPEIGDG